MRCFVIGDIHGCPNELRYLIEDLPLESGDRLVFLGDYVDRGPDSKGVVSYLLELQKNATYDFIFLKGNHEDMFLSYLGLPGQYGDMFLFNGGKVTLESYGLSTTNSAPDERLAQIPPAHLDFYKNLRNYYVAAPFLCVHAGIDPLKPLEDQTESDMFWIRNQFIYRSHMLPYIVLFGHTPQDDVFYDLPYKIGLDTGLVYGNKLTCLETQEKMLYQINRGKKTVRRTPILKNWDNLLAALTP
ncbi:MAG TPA: metallophosphoesterase family protein [Methylomirabilota bacterium]|nr:metallophosphoesterase family protein [Methylomirabilota bacterium]